MYNTRRNALITTVVTNAPILIKLLLFQTVCGSRKKIRPMSPDRQMPIRIKRGGCGIPALTKKPTMVSLFQTQLRQPAEIDP